MEWFVAYTKPRAESKAVHHLQNQGFAVYLPRYLKRRRHARRTDWVASPLFPRYLFVGVDPARSRWRAIGSTIGIAGLVCRGADPAPVSPELLRSIQARENAEGYIALSAGRKFNWGDRVTITEGIFAGLTGLFECIRDDQRITLMLHLLGRELRVVVPTYAL
jgi:transcriptional antiterminator RfaH